MNYVFDGENKTLAIGAYPSVDLRKRDEARRMIEEGVDPLVARQLKVQANIEAARNTFKKVAREWHEANSPQWARRHADEILRSFERDAFPSLGNLPITAITPPKLLETVRRTRQRVSGVYAYATASGIADAGVERDGLTPACRRPRRSQAFARQPKLLSWYRCSSIATSRCRWIFRPRAWR